MRQIIAQAKAGQAPAAEMIGQLSTALDRCARLYEMTVMGLGHLTCDRHQNPAA